MENLTQIPEQEQLKERLKAYLEKNFNEVRELHSRRVESGTAIAKMRSDIIDKLITTAFKELGFEQMEGVTIGALGGYGRRELSPYSDIDLMFLHDPKCEELAKTVSESMLYILWDLGLEIGHSTRTLKDCLELSRDDDATILTAMLDGRPICGDTRLWVELDRELFTKLLPSYSTKFIEKKLVEYEKRIDKYGSSVYMLEPHIKEGEGGLRDIHSALWIAKAKYKLKTFNELLQKSIIIDRDLKAFEKGLDFLLTIRSELHYLSGRRDDVLSFQWQEKIAEFLGYIDKGELPAVERFMRVYYLNANQIHEYSQKLLETCIRKPKARYRARRAAYLDEDYIIRDGTITITDPDVFKDHPERMMKAFEYAYTKDIHMSPFLSDMIRESLHLIDDKIRRKPEFNEPFLNLLKNGKNVSTALFQMNRIRLLGHYIPEFGKIVCLAQHDAYHVYPVDIHSIFMVREIENIHNLQGDEFNQVKSVALDVPERHILYLGCLTHDMGKGQGKNHSKKGSLMIPKVAERMGLTPKETVELQFLVMRHLIMPHISQRRDMHDESLIIRFAKLVKTLDTLKLLYLLTFADIRSVGPDVWTNWKGMLLNELYSKTAAVLESGKYRRESPKTRAARVRAIVIEKLSDVMSKDRAIEFLSDMPLSYFSVFSPKKIVDHVMKFEKVKDEIGVDIVFNTKDGFDEFTFWGSDEVGIFSKLCGVLSANGINIMGARIVTQDKGRILDVFYVNRLGESTYNHKEIWDKVWKNLFAVLDGAEDVEKLVAKRKKMKPKYEKEVPKYPSKIEFDNESSDLNTVIDIYTHDRIGLLYDIATTLTDLGLSIDYAKISTKVDQVADVFYVSDTEEGKIIHQPKMNKIRKALIDAIDEKESTSRV